MTKYRIISDGYADFLQYLKPCSFLFIKWNTWSYIWWPYYDKISGRSLDCLGVKCNVCSYNNKLNDFSQKWPRIKEYFKWANIEQEKLESIATDYYNEKEKKKKQVIYL